MESRLERKSLLPLLYSNSLSFDSPTVGTLPTLCSGVHKFGEKTAYYYHRLGCVLYQQFLLLLLTLSRNRIHCLEPYRLPDLGRFERFSKELLMWSLLRNVLFVHKLLTNSLKRVILLAETRLSYLFITLETAIFVALPFRSLICPSIFAATSSGSSVTRLFGTRVK